MPEVRLFFATQAVDAARFVHDPAGAQARAQASFAEQARAVLAQPPGHPVPLEEQACQLRCFVGRSGPLYACGQCLSPSLWTHG